MIGTSPPAVVGGYRLMEPIGAGGMGEVYRAVHERLGREAAVKFLRRLGGEPGVTARFLNEARIHAALEHPNIATLYDFLEVDGVACIVMEYVRGPTLADRIRDEGPLAPREALEILAQLLDAVAFVHRHGVVHRDLKSSNVKIDPGGRVKLLDFGVSRSRSGPRLTREGAVVGTPESIAPENLDGAPADERSDVWALGVLLYEMVTGRLPFLGDSVAETGAKIRRGRYAPPSSVVPGLPRSIDALVARCLQVDPERRFGSVEAMADAVALPEAPRGPILTRRAFVAIAGGAAIALAAIGLVAGLRHVSTSRAPAAGEVRLVIDSQPAGAKVYEDGSYVGKTPCALTRAAGTSLALVLRKDGYVEKRQDVLVGASTRAVTVVLDRRP